MTLAALRARQHDAAEPFSLSVSGQPFRAEKVLRLIPGKRLVASGTWSGHPVVAKIFFADGGKAASYEAEVLKKLAAAGIRVPAVLYLDKQGGDSILLMEKVSGQDLAEVMAAGDDETQVAAVLELVWKLFQSGWIQTDLHFGNFFATDHGLCCIDAGAMKEVSPSAVKAFRENLALFVVQSPLAMQLALIEQVRTAMKKWAVDSDDFAQLCRSQLRRRIRKADRKWQRDCTAVAVEKRADRTVYLDRQWQGARKELDACCEALDQVPVIKDGRRVRVHGNARWIIKHYHGMGLKGRLRQRMQRSHGMISWRRGYTWALLGIPTPRPLLLLEITAGPRAGESVVIFPRCNGVQLSILMEQQRERAKAVAVAVRRWLELFCWAGLRHGDIKAQNILVDAEDTVIFIDLDAAAITTSESKSARWSKREIARFENNWEQFR